MLDRLTTPDPLLDTRGLRAAAILAALYNAASKTGLGENDPGPAAITEAEAMALLRTCFRCPAFDYLYGKRLKLDLTEAEEGGIITAQYDYGQGRGTARAAIEILRRTGDPCHPDIIALQEKSRATSKVVSAPRPESGTTSEGNLADVLELTDRSDDENPDSQFDRLRNTPCITFNL